MKKTIIALLAAVGFIAYLLGRKKAPVTHQPIDHSHHLTKVFSKAKQHAVHS